MQKTQFNLRRKGITQLRDQLFNTNNSRSVRNDAKNEIKRRTTKFKINALK